MRRREFVSFLAGTIAWPLAAKAQAAKPVIGFLRPTMAEDSGHLVAALRQGLRESDYPPGQVAIEPRWGNNQNAQVPKLAAELVTLQVAVIVAASTIFGSGSEGSYVKHSDCLRTNHGYAGNR
jgi:putative tryptophan/tyrosine transport system substrate-binding protein